MSLLDALTDARSSPYTKTAYICSIMKTVFTQSTPPTLEGTFTTARMTYRVIFWTTCLMNPDYNTHNSKSSVRDQF